MIIKGRRIRNIRPYFNFIRNNSTIVLGLRNAQNYLPKLQSLGFSEALRDSQSILPASFGPVSSFNANGKYIVHKDQPMEKAYRQAEWHWTEWHGPYRVEQSKLVDIPYKRYPRTFVPPFSVEFTVISKSGSFLLVGPSLIKNNENEENLKHVVNLFLEVFGECEIFTEDLERIAKIPLIRLNWEILPRGEMPWEKLKKHIEPILSKVPKGNQPVVKYRLETINKMKPDFTAVGRGGFRGYIIHGFSDKSIYVLESMYYGNATYVFDQRWEQLSKKTKAEILNYQLQKDRVIHRLGWTKRITEIIKAAN